MHIEIPVPQDSRSSVFLFSYKAVHIGFRKSFFSRKTFLFFKFSIHKGLEKAKTRKISVSVKYKFTDSAEKVGSFPCFQRSENHKIGPKLVHHNREEFQHFELTMVSLAAAAGRGVTDRSVLTTQEAAIVDKDEVVS